MRISQHAKSVYKANIFEHKSFLFCYQLVSIDLFNDIHLSFVLDAYLVTFEIWSSTHRTLITNIFRSSIHYPREDLLCLCNSSYSIHGTLYVFYNIMLDNLFGMILLSISFLCVKHFGTCSLQEKCKNVKIPIFLILRVISE